MVRIIGIGEYDITNNPDDVIKTYALSSCVALTVYARMKKVMGMAHIVLPSSQIMADRMCVNPAYCADTAVPLLIEKICSEYGCASGELELKLFGGAESIRTDDTFNIGTRNVEMIEAILKEMNLKTCYTDTGGNKVRSVTADAATGKVKVDYQPLMI